MRKHIFTHSTMIKPRRCLLPFKVLLLIALSSAKDAHTQDNEHSDEENALSPPASSLLPTHLTPLPRSTNANADKQGFLGPGGGWYENGPGSNFHSDYPYPRDPYLADSQFWPDYGWDQRHNFPYVWVGHKEVEEVEESTGGVILAEKTEAGMDKIEAGLNKDGPSNSTVSKNQKKGDAKIATESEALAEVVEQEEEESDLDHAEQDSATKQMGEGGTVSEKAELAKVQVGKNMDEPLAMAGSEREDADKKVNAKSVVSATDLIPNGRNDKVQVNTEKVKEGEEGVAVPIVVVDKDKLASRQGGATVVVATPIEEVKVKGAGQSAVVIDKQYYNGGYGDSYYGNGYFSAYWQKGHKGGGISLGGDWGGGSGYAPYYGYGGGPGYNQNWGQGYNNQYGGSGYNNQYGGPGYGYFGGGCCRRLRGPLHRA